MHIINGFDVQYEKKVSGRGEWRIFLFCDKLAVRLGIETGKKGWIVCSPFVFFFLPLCSHDIQTPQG